MFLLLKYLLLFYMYLYCTNLFLYNRVKAITRAICCPAVIHCMREIGMMEGLLWSSSQLSCVQYYQEVLKLCSIIFFIQLFRMHKRKHTVFPSLSMVYHNCKPSHIQEFLLFLSHYHLYTCFQDLAYT